MIRVDIEDKTLGLWLEPGQVSQLRLPPGDESLELHHDGEQFEVEWFADAGLLGGDAVAILLTDQLENVDEVLVVGRYPSLHLFTDERAAERYEEATAAPRARTAMAAQRAATLARSVDKRIDESALSNGTLRLGPAEASGLGLDGHRVEVTLAFDGDRLPATWQPRSSTLEGEALRELLELETALGDRVRLERSVDGELMLQVLGPESRERWSTGLQGFWDDDVASEPIAAAPRSSPRRLRTRSLRLRTDGDYRWTGDVGFHREMSTRLADDLRAARRSDEAWSDLRVVGEELALLDSFDELLAPDVLNFELFPWQEAAARVVLSRLRGRAVLADEVGLGKTIEAGLLVKELILRGQARRILISCPSTLRDQWREELHDKFDEAFTVITSSAQLAGAGDRLIMSPQMLHQNVDLLARTSWDVLILDEAHKWMGSGEATRSSHERLAGRFTFLLTATPVQNNLAELYRLVELLRPGTFASLRDFRRRYIDQSDPRRPVREVELRQLVSDVMVRTTRAQAGIDRVKRRITDVAVELSPAERTIYDAVVTILRLQDSPLGELQRRSLALRLVSSLRGLAKTADRMAQRVTHRPTAQLLLEVSELAAEFGAKGHRTTRQEHLLRLLGEWVPAHDRVLVFSQHTDTVEDLLRLLAEVGIPAAGFHGKMSARAKSESIRRFRSGEVAVLISSDAGAEGQNLQFAYCVVNYDLPWNPMRIEQRIGRVHRLSQESDVVHVANFFARDTVDERVYELLHDKLAMFELLFGQVTTILGELDGSDGSRTFEGRVIEALVADDDDEMRTRLERLGSALAAARSRSAEGLVGDGGRSSWLDRTEDRFSHRRSLEGTDATELVPTVPERDAARQRAVQQFVRQVLTAAGATTEVDTTTDGVDGNGSFLSVCLPEELSEQLGTDRLHLAFDRIGLQNHPAAELCAAGTDVLEELLDVVRAHPMVVVTAPVVPEAATLPVPSHHEDVELVDRRFSGPSELWASATWRLSTGEGTDERIHTVTTGQEPSWRLPRRTHDAGEHLPRSVTKAERVWEGVQEETEADLRELARQLTEERCQQMAAESGRLREHYQKRIDELEQEMWSASFGRRGELEERSRDLRRTMEATARTAAPEVRLRAEPVALRIELGEDLTVHERWRSADGTTIDLSWPYEPDGPRRVVDRDGDPIERLTVCRSGHAADVDRSRSCDCCDAVVCAPCVGAGELYLCDLCGTDNCDGCMGNGSLCPACTAVERRPDLDDDVSVAFALASGWGVRVRHRSAEFTSPDGERSTVLPGEGLERHLALEALARLADIDGDAEAFDLDPTAEPDVDDADLRLDVRREIELVALPATALPPTPASDEVLSRTVDDLELVPESRDGGDVPTGVRELVARLRDRSDAQLPPLPAVGIRTVVDVRRVRLRAEGLLTTQVRHRGATTEELRSELSEWVTSGQTELALATVEGLVVRLHRRNRGLVVEIVPGEAEEEQRRWLAPSGAGLDGELWLHSILTTIDRDDVHTSPATAVPPEPGGGFAEPNGATLAQRTLARCWRVEGDELGRAVPEPKPHHEAAQPLQLDDAAELLDRFVPSQAVSLRPSFRIRETWRANTPGQEPAAVTVDYHVDGEDAAWPPDHGGRPTASVSVDRFGHLHAADDATWCLGCEKDACRHCVQVGVLAPCNECARHVCPDCLAGAPADAVSDPCALCGEARCTTCSFDPAVSPCPSCGRSTCGLCRTADGDEGGLTPGSCRTCGTFREADDPERDALPRFLALEGCDVHVTDREADGTVLVAITSLERSEIVELRDGELVRWWDVRTSGGGELRDLKRRIALWAGVPTDIALVVDPGTDDVDTREGPLAFRRTPEQQLTFRLSRRGETVAVSEAAPTRLVPGTWRELVQRVASPPWETGGPSPTAAPLPGLRPPGQPRVVTELTLELQLQTSVDEVRVTHEGLRRVSGTTSDPQVETAAWRALPGDDVERLGFEPAPTAAVRSNIGAVEITVAATGDDVAALIHTPEGRGWLRVRGDEPSRRRVALAAHFGGTGQVWTLEHPSPEHGQALVVRDAARIEHRVEISGQLAAANDVGADDVGDELITRLRITSRPLPPMRAAPEELANVLSNVADQHCATPRLHLAVMFDVTETWRGASWERTFSYLVTPPSYEVGLPVDDVDGLASSVTVDANGHIAAQPLKCLSCGSWTCRRCPEVARPCELCGWVSCGRCRAMGASRCSACHSLRLAGRREVRDAGLKARRGTHALIGEAATHRVMLVPDREGWVRRIVPFTGPQFLGPVSTDRLTFAQGALASRTAVELRAQVRDRRRRSS